jgi:hypothetical protein
MDEILSAIVSALRRIQTEGGDGNFVIFSDEKTGYYIQFAGEKGGRRLYEEAVSNNALMSPLILNQTQIEKLLAMGWTAASPIDINFFREWYAESDFERTQIANEVQRTFSEVYLVNFDQEIDIDLVLE